MDTVKDVLVEVVIFLFLPILTVGFGILSALTDSSGLSLFFAILALAALGFFVVKYWTVLYIGWLGLLLLGGGAITAGALTLVWEFVTFDGNSDSVLRDWKYPFTFFFVLYIIAWVVYAIVLTDIIDMAIKFIKGLSKR